MRTSMAVIALAGAIALGEPAGAQRPAASQHDARQAPARAGGSRTPTAAGTYAGIAPPPATAPARPAKHHRRDAIPVIVTADGRAYANVGYGWEPVVAPCPAGACTTSVPSAAAGQSGSRLPDYRPPAYTLPTYGPQKNP
jgi:hypothetical protein